MSDEMHTKHEVVICEKCNGFGESVTQILVDYHRGEYEDDYEICTWCNGTGRIFKTKKWITFSEPFDLKKSNHKNIRRKLSE